MKSELIRNTVFLDGKRFSPLDKLGQMKSLLESGISKQRVLDIKEHKCLLDEFYNNDVLNNREPTNDYDLFKKTATKDEFLKT